ncbi:TrkA family potassium uptake protein [Salinifilum aidingensis]
MAESHRPHRRDRVVVIGLGRFGGSLAAELTERGSEVLALDNRPNVIHQFADSVAYAAVTDATDPESLRQLDVHHYRTAVNAIGDDLESSVLTTSNLTDMGLPHIWAKAVTRQHARILERVGANHVVLPEHDMGRRTAHLVTGRMLDYIQLEDDFAIAKTRAPAGSLDKPLEESRIRSHYRVTIVGIKRPGEGFTYATQRTVLHADDLLIISGLTGDVERFANLT